MQNLLFSIGGFVIAIGILVAIHEYGHYLAARWCNVKVLKFSVGFGKSLFTKVSGKDNTEYTLAAIPLGGYVKMLDDAEDAENPEDKARAFNNQPLHYRAFIVFAGPLANFLFAIVAFAGVNMIGEPKLEAVVEYVEPNSIAAQAGFAPLDKIIEIDGRVHRHWDDNNLYLFNSVLNQQRLDIKVEQANGDLVARQLDLGLVEGWEPNQPLLETTLGLYPFDRQIKPVIGSVQEDSPAALVGLKVGDEIVAIDGIEINHWQQLVSYVKERAGQALELEIRSQAGTQTIAVTPQSISADGRTIGRLGITNQRVEFPQEKFINVSYGLGEAFARAVDSTWKMSVLTVRMLWKILTLEYSPKNISGPITIAEYAGKTAQIGLTSFLLFLAFISISLGVINLMPVPMLDGGHLLTYLIEAVKGSPLSQGSLIIGQKIGLAILGALMFLAFYNDIARLTH